MTVARAYHGPSVIDTFVAVNERSPSDGGARVGKSQKSAHRTERKCRIVFSQYCLFHSLVEAQRKSASAHTNTMKIPLTTTRTWRFGGVQRFSVQREMLFMHGKISAHIKRNGKRAIEKCFISGRTPLKPLDFRV